MGENNRNLPKLVEIMAIVLSRIDLLEAKHVPRMLTLFKSLQTSVPSQVNIPTLLSNKLQVCFTAFSRTRTSGNHGQQLKLM